MNYFAIEFSIELEKTLRDDSEIILMQMLANYGMLESQMAENFQNNSNKRFREGMLKKSFNYLLIDPRISENLPAESLVCTKLSKITEHQTYSHDYVFSVDLKTRGLAPVHKLDILCGQRKKQPAICTPV